jgi:NAD(P)-dependent dehydrogenase (short-subunit alcohol dehydrogenase family)
MYKLENKTAVITGAGSGIGQAIAITFARQGAHVAVLDLQKEAAESTVATIEQQGGKASARVVDVSDQGAVEKCIRDYASAQGRLDILVNNAGVACIGTVMDTSREDMDSVYRVNILGVYHCLKAAVGIMEPQGHGVILNLASLASITAVKDRFAYSMSKGAVLTMTYSVAEDYVKKGIRCNCICPARVHTPFVDGYLAKYYPGKEQEKFEELSAYQPIGRMAQPEEIAALVLYLCSDEAAFITGAAYPIDGGVLNLY